MSFTPSGFHDEIRLFQSSLENKVVEILTLNAMELFRMYPALISFKWEQPPFHSPNIHDVINGLSINGEAVISQQGLAAFKEKMKKMAKEGGKDCPLFAKELTMDYNSLVEVADKLVEFLSWFCDASLCKLFGNRLAMEVTRRVICIKEVEI